MRAPKICTVLCSVHYRWSSVHHDAASETQIRNVETIWDIWLELGEAVKIVLTR